MLGRFFVILLLYSQPGDPRALFDKYLERLLPPPRRDRANDFERRNQQLLKQIQRMLEEAGRSMRDFGLPEPAPDLRSMDERLNEELIPPVYDPQTGDPIDMTAEERAQRADALYQSCNSDQRRFIDLVFERHHELTTDHRSRVTNLILLKGEGGTGKTHALNALIELSHARGIPIRACAFTGIAATRLLGGTTAHSLFGIPVDSDADTPSDIKFSFVTADSYQGNLLRRTMIFIIDEVGMLHIDDIYCVNMLMKDLRNTGVRFGRALFIFTGDVRQIMPIVKGADPLGDRQGDASFFFSAD